MKEYHLTTLDNGLKVISVPMPVKSAAVFVAVGAGSRFENERTQGVFHFMEHMAFKGTKKRPDTLSIATSVDAVGGIFNAYTSKETTAYHIKLAKQHMPMAFDVLSDILTDSLFAEEEIEREKGVIIEEINMIKDTPMQYIGDVFMRLLYGDNAMGWSVGGEKATVAGLGKKDFLDYLGKLYFGANMVLVVAGGVGPKEVKELAEKYFSPLREIGQKVTEGIAINQEKPRLKIVERKTEQTHFCLGVPAYRLGHPDRYALSVLSAVFGQGMSSRLFLEVRERRGLAYYVSSDTEEFVDSGFLVVQSGVRTDKSSEAVKVVLDQMEKLTKEKVGEKELEKAKEMLCGQLVLAMENPKNVADRYADQLVLEGEIKTPTQTMLAIKRVTAEDVQRVAVDLLKPEKVNLAVIGPHNGESEFGKIIGIEG